MLTYHAEREGLASYDTLMDMKNVRLKVGMLELPPTGFVVGLVEFRNPEPVRRELKNYFVGASSMALQVESAEEEYDRLNSAGIETMSGPTEIVREGRTTAIAFCVLDPDGIPIEIWEPVDSDA